MKKELKSTCHSGLDSESSARAHNTKAYHVSGCPIGSGMTGESGRSMIEMLGVLAIIGVLSVGGIYGYTTAMRSYKANEIVNSTSMLYMMGIASNAGTGDADLSYSSVMGTLPAECAGIDYSGSTKQITTKVQDQAVCYQVKNKLGDKVTDGDCSTKTDGSYDLTVTLGEATTSVETPASYDCSNPNGMGGQYYCTGSTTDNMNIIHLCDSTGEWKGASRYCSYGCIDHELHNTLEATCVDGEHEED